VSSHGSPLRAVRKVAASGHVIVTFYGEPLSVSAWALGIRCMPPPHESAARRRRPRIVIDRYCLSNTLTACAVLPEIWSVSVSVNCFPSFDTAKV